MWAASLAKKCNHLPALPPFCSIDLRQLFCHVVDWGIEQRKRERESGGEREAKRELRVELNSSPKCQLPKMVKHIFNKLLGVCLCRLSPSLCVPLSFFSPLSLFSLSLLLSLFPSLFGTSTCYAVCRSIDSGQMERKRDKRRSQ